ncbi:MAG: trehalose-6-phosphate synthase [Deltaproteobacteria bacterium]|nr:trehalose-6-phosphate synthase [Deltaproteobacteria bacterium]
MAWIASLVANSVTRRWFEKDVQVRAHGAFAVSRQAVIHHWRSGRRQAVGRIFEGMAHDRLFLAVAACSRDGTPVARSPRTPAQLTCRKLATMAGVPRPADEAAWRAWTRAVAVHEGNVDLTILPLRDRGQTLGMVAFVHDMSFAAEREAATESFYLAAFAILALAAAGFTVLVGTLSERRWITQVRGLLRGDPVDGAAGFGPIVRDFRELVARVQAEAESAGGAGAWTPERLRQLVGRHLSGEKIIIVANREPYIHERGAGGEIEVLHPASGLVTALEPIMRACSGVWVGHGSGSADRETADSQGRVAVPPGEESYAIRRVWLGPDEERGYYEGFANEGLWPLCHIAHTRPIFRGEDWMHYQRVNRKFAAAACAEATSDEPIVFVQDYHFALVPRLVRAREPRATVLAFWHIPWPNSEHFGICPLRYEIMEGLLGSSILGFQTQLHCNNFLDAVDRYMEARIDRERQAVVYQGRVTLVRPYPISVEWPIRWVQAVPSVDECRREVLGELGLPPDAILGLGVDRLDYTKGIEERLRAVERLLERFPALRGRFTFVQIAAPSRTPIERYRELRRQVEALAASINARFGSGSWHPVVLRCEHHEPPRVFRHYRAADLCYVSSLHDGMNLVAKEFVAARDDERGVLILSHFTGAARELTEALVVNPYDLEQASAALAAAIAMPADEQAERMRSMRAFLADFNVYRWAGRILVDAARLRQRYRFSSSALERASVR